MPDPPHEDEPPDPRFPEVPTDGHGPRLRDEHDPQLRDALVDPAEVQLPGPETTVWMIRGVERHDPEAEKAFVERFLPILARRAHRRLSARARRLADTHDIEQGVLCEFLEHVSRVRAEHPGATQAYLMTMIQRHIADIEKAAWNRNEYTEPTGMDQIADPAPGPSTEYEKRLARALVNAALGTLSDQEREAVTLRAQGLRPGEVAQRLGLEEGDTTRAFIRRAVAKYEAAYEHLRNPKSGSPGVRPSD